MKTTLVTAFFSSLFLLSSVASANVNPHCKLTVLTTSVISGGATWNILQLPNLALDSCQAICRDRNVLQTYVDPYSLIFSCKMTHSDADGKITKAKYRFPKLTF